MVIEHETDKKVISVIYYDYVGKEIRVDIKRNNIIDKLFSIHSKFTSKMSMLDDFNRCISDDIEDVILDVAEENQLVLNEES